MVDHGSGSNGTGLERSCEGRAADWVRGSDAGGGVALLEAWFGGEAYRPHRHDTYAIGVTETGVQAFRYRGASYVSLPGEVVVLHPDEVHDGYAGSEAGFGYRLLYVAPALISAAARELWRGGGGGPLPFVRAPVVPDGTLAATIRAAFRGELEPLALDELVVGLAEGLSAADPAYRGDPPRPRRPRIDGVAVARARALLEAETTRVVPSWELEAATGLSRYALARQFRAAVGTSPSRYGRMRRLDAARAEIGRGRPLVEIALGAGFADQAHFGRAFAAAFGLTPARYRALCARDAG